MVGDDLNNVMNFDFMSPKKIWKNKKRRRDLTKENSLVGEEII